MVSTKAIRQSLYQKLNVSSVTSNLADGSASIFYGRAPTGAHYPFLIFAKQSGRAVDRFGGLAYDTQVWLVKTVTSNDEKALPGKAEDTAAAVNTLLDFGTLTISGGSLMHLARISDVDYTETEGDQVYSHNGALYRVVVQD